MAASQMSKVIQHLRRTVLLSDGAGLTDGQLLECFIDHRDEAAFAALVKRHGPMVWGVCRRLLNHHDAEDAFQATFLVLSRKADSVVPRERVANWLYGVAHQTALQAKRNATRRRARERQVTEMPEPAVTGQDLWSDLQPLLDQELSLLPDKYREVIVLCDLEGKTRKDAARQLRLPEGTIGSRLARARVMLAKRLARHGLAMSAGALAAVLTKKAASAGVPSSVMSSTIKVVTLVAAGQAAATGAISLKVAALTEGVLKTMLLTKLKMVTFVLLAVAVFVGGAGLIYQTQAAGQPKPQQVNETAKASQTEKTDLPGTWKAVSLKVNGEQQDSDVLSKQPVTVTTWTFTGNKVHIRGGDQSMEARYTQDSSTYPKQIDLTFITPDPNGEKDVQAEVTGLGIYGVDGDTLKVCFIINPNGTPYRPRKLEVKDVRMTYYYTFHREGSPAKKADNDKQPAEKDKKPKPDKTEKNGDKP